MLFFFAFSIDKNVIKIYYQENVELLYQNFVYVILQYGWCISESKKHDLVFEVAIMGFEGRFQFISFSNPHLVVGIGQNELDELLSLT